MVCSVATSLFERGIRQGEFQSSALATQKILKSPDLKNAFDNLLRSTKDRIMNLVESVKKMVGVSLSNSRNIKDELKEMRRGSDSEDSLDQELSHGALNK